MLKAEFPPVATVEWEAAIQKDLKGADYEKRLVWRTEEGLAIRPYYRSESLTGLETQLAAKPGEFPFVRGTARPWEPAQDYTPGPDAIRADWLHEAGAHAVQELGYAIAAGVERLSARPAGEPLEVAAQRMEFVFAVGPAYFVEIAKFRAARLLWAQAVQAFGPKDATAARMRLAVRTPLRNKSLSDPYTNLLRVTTESLAAVIGGCDSLTVEPFGFDPHLAANVQRILQSEAHMDAVADPAGGSYYVEALTAILSREAWKLFQQVEADGGYAKAVESGSIDRALAVSRVAREKAISSRRRTLVGVNNYPNLLDTSSAAEAAGGRFPRLAEPFEKIRARTARMARETGRYPRVALLKRGDLKMRSARANFCLNFFGCAGFEMIECGDLAALDADLVVLCSSDPEYLALAKEICAETSKPVIVAGNPKEQIEELRAAGVQGFVHMGSDAVETLTQWQDRLEGRSSQ